MSTFKKRPTPFAADRAAPEGKRRDFQVFGFDQSRVRVENAWLLKPMLCQKQIDRRN